MTKEEEEIFKDKISELIMPIAKNMTQEQIKNIILNVEKSNESLPKGFASMLYEQIYILKQKNIYGK